MDKLNLPNYYYFDDDKFLELLRTANAINDIERYLYTEKKKNWWGLLNYDRKKFTKFYIFFDEAWAIANNQNKLENNNVYAEYINQNRKNFEEIYIITAKWDQTNKTLRRMVDWWYYVKPFANFPLLKDIWIIRRQQKDDEWKILTYKYIWKDQNWDEILKEKPLDEYFWFFFKPTIWNLYDDLHKNIADNEKYINIDIKLLTQILEAKPRLKNIVKDKEEFNPIKTNLLKNEDFKLEDPIFAKKEIKNDKQIESHLKHLIKNNKISDKNNWKIN